MTATSVKNDPACGSVDQTVFVGNIGLIPFHEGEDPQYAEHKATNELAIDILAPDGYEKVEFEDITLTLEILLPTEALFVDHSNRNNYRWEVPDGAGGWTETATATHTLRIGVDKSELISGPGNGLTSYVGVSNPGRKALQFSAVAEAAKVRAHAISCAITVNDLTDGDRLPGYLG
jgi:hypothetical protein